MNIKNNAQIALVSLVSVMKYYIFKPRKVFFDHLPKCGGSSLRSFLETQYPKNRIFSIHGSSINISRKNISDFKEYSRNKRFFYSLIEGHGAHELIDYIDPKCLKITILRYPVDRIISHYYFVKRFPKHYLHDKMMLLNMKLEDYVASDLSEELTNWYTIHFSSMSLSDLRKNPDEAFEKALENMLKYDLIGFLDDYPLFIRQLKEHANFKKCDNLEKRNATIDRPHIDEVSSDVKEIIKERNSLDIELYSILKRKFSSLSNI